MHIFRWLMSHPIITAWILAALAILLNINMGSKNTHEDIEHGEVITSEVVESKSIPVSTGHAHADENDSTIEHSRTDKTDSTDSSMHSSEAEIEVSPRGVVREKVDQTTTGKTVAEAGQVAINTAVVEHTDDNSVSSSDDVSESKEDSNALSANGLDSLNQEDLLKLAREAFWQNEKDKSAAIYQALVEREPSSLAYKGEWANVLWHQNKQKESAALYAEIAMPMLEQGKTREVGNMLGFIGVFFPEKAREIHRSMSE